MPSIYGRLCKSLRQIPASGSLWAIGKSSANSNFQLFVIDPTTGAATAIGTPYTTAGLNGATGVNTWGFDFNPAIDRIRLVNSDTTNNNYVLNPNVANGVVTTTGPNLSFAAGDPNVGTIPQVDGAAYSTAAFAGTTSLYYLDANLNALLQAVNVDTGTVRTVGPLGVLIDEPNGFDIFQSLALFSVPTASGSSLYSVDLTTGGAQLAGDFPAGIKIRGLTISTAVPVPPLPGPPYLHVNGKAKRTVVGTPALVRGQATDESGVVALSYRVANRSASYTGALYTNPFEIKVRRLAFGTNRVIIRASDPSGNITDKTITIVRRR